MSTKNAAAPSKSPEKVRAKMQIVEYLRGQIVGGKLASADRLPTQRELKERFSTSKTTVESAFDILAKEGFISAEGARGTFVAEHPPHTSRYALAFPGSAKEVAGSPFWTKLCAEAGKKQDSYNYRVELFYEIHPLESSGDYRRLLHEVRTHQLAGIIYAADPSYLSNTAFMQALDVPVVAISTRTTEFFAPLVQINYDSFFNRSLDILVQRRKKSVAVIAPHLTTTQRESFFRGVAARGMKTEPYWWLPVDLNAAETASIYSHLLLNANQKVRPDALIIADDTFVEATLQGVHDAGVRIPQDIEIVALSNFPAATPRPAVMQRVGYSVPQVLQSCLQLIGLQRAGQTVPALTVISAFAEEEIEQMPSGLPLWQ